MQISGRAVALILLLGTGFAGLAWVTTNRGVATEEPQDGPIQPQPVAAEPLDEATDVALRAPVRAPSQEPVEPREVVLLDPASVVSPPVAADPFPYGRPTPDWVFEQKYAGKSESELDDIEERVKAEFSLASKAAFKECWATGDYEVLPAGVSYGSEFPGDERLVGGQSIPGSKDSMATRLSIEKYPQVYLLWYEHLWLSTRKRAS